MVQPLLPLFFRSCFSKLVSFNLRVARIFLFWLSLLVNSPFPGFHSIPSDEFFFHNPARARSVDVLYHRSFFQSSLASLGGVVFFKV